MDTENASPQLETISVGESNQAIRVARCEITIESGQSFCVWVDSQADDSISRSLIEHTYAAPLSYRLLSVLVRPGLRVLDLGAHIGTFSLFACQLGCNVLAIEASILNVALLRFSAETNRFDNLRILNQAISDHAGEIEFFQSGPYGVVNNPYIASPTIAVQANTVDEILKDIGWGKIDFIKMDIEGSEVAAAKGMRHLLSQQDAPPILFESNGHTLHMFGYTPADLRSAIEQFGYTCYLVDPQGLTRVLSDDLQPDCVADYLAVKTHPNSSFGPINSSLSFEETVNRIVATATHPHPHIRTYIARALSHPNTSLYIKDEKVKSVLHRLAGDKHADVLQAIAWWKPSHPWPSVLNRVVVNIVNQVKRWFR